jgi:siroheme synthase
VSAAIAGPAAAGIPVTQRHWAASFAVVTGHRDPTSAGRVDLPAVAAAVDTLVVLMGMARLEEILVEVARVRPAKTPAAAIMWGTTKDKRSVVGTLDDLAHRVRAEGLMAPSVLVIGDVAAIPRLLQEISTGGVRRD